MSSSGQRNPQDKTQRISGSLPLLKSFLSCGPDIVSGPTDAEPLLLKENRDSSLLCVSSCVVVGTVVLSSLSPQQLVLSGPAFVFRPRISSGLSRRAHGPVVSETVCHVLLTGVQLSLTALCFSHVKTSPTDPQPSSLAWSRVALFGCRKPWKKPFVLTLLLNEKHVCCDSKSHFSPNLISLQFFALLVAQPTLVLF